MSLQGSPYFPTSEASPGGGIGVAAGYPSGSRNTPWDPRSLEGLQRAGRHSQAGQSEGSSEGCSHHRSCSSPRSAAAYTTHLSQRPVPTRGQGGHCQPCRYGVFATRFLKGGWTPAGAGSKRLQELKMSRTTPDFIKNKKEGMRRVNLLFQEGRSRKRKRKTLNRYLHNSLYP